MKTFFVVYFPRIELSGCNTEYSWRKEFNFNILKVYSPCILPSPNNLWKSCGWNRTKSIIINLSGSLHTRWPKWYNKITFETKWFSRHLTSEPPFHHSLGYYDSILYRKVRLKKSCLLGITVNHIMVMIQSARFGDWSIFQLILL